MLRYIIGISLVAALIMIIRKLSDGKILKKHQYALWLLIPLYMIVSPFLKVNLPILEAPSVPVVTTQTELVPENGTSNVDAEPIQPVNIDQEQTVYPEINKNTNVENRVVENKAPVNISGLVKTISLSVSAALIFAFTVYNFGFILYCRRKRYFIRQDKTCGLKIYAIKYKGTPFLLFNKIYVDEKSDGNNEYIICHEACHHKHGDPVWIVMRYLILALNWYNPVIWAAFFLSGIDCELACDEEAIRLLGQDYSAGYANSLYEMLKQQSEVTFGFTASTGMRSEFKTMKKRIANIKSPAKKSYKALALCMAIIVAFSGCTLVNPTAAVPEVNTTSTVPFGDISNAKIRLSNNGIVPCVFDADENQVKELARVFNASEWQEAGVDFPDDLDGEGVNIFVDNNGEYFQLFFRTSGYVKYQRSGDTDTKLYKVSNEAEAAAWNIADPKDPSTIQDRLIQLQAEDFTPEGVWKYVISESVPSSSENNTSKIAIGSDATLPDPGILSQSYPATLNRSIDADYQQKLTTGLLGSNYKKDSDSDTEIMYSSTDPSLPKRYIWINKTNNELHFYDAMVTGERGGEYKAAQMNMLPEESISLAQEKAAAIVGQDRVSIPSQSGLLKLRISLKDQATYESATREMDAHVHVFERRTDKNISILDGGVKVRIGVDGISDLMIDCSNYSNSGSDTITPVTLDEALTIASGICYNNETTVFYAELAYSNWCTENDNFNLSWHIVTNRGNYVVDCVTRTAKCDVDTY